MRDFQDLAKKGRKIIVVTGGAGFLGSHLVDFLLGKGNRVICVDNFFTGSAKNLKKASKNKNFKFIKHDIINPLYIKGKIHQIYNLACPASPVHYQRNPVRTIKANTIGVINMLGLARKHKARILQASTSEVYGNPLEHPQREEYRGNVSTIGPRACYDEGKRCAETLFFDYYRMHKMEIKVARIFNTYGPRMALDDGRVVSNFIVQALRGNPITVYGKGNQTRSLCYVDDLIRGLCLFMESEAAFMGPVNLGNPDTEITIKKLAEGILKLCGSKSRIIFSELPQDDPEKRMPDISKAKKFLGWKPETSFEDGMRKTMEYFAEEIKRL